MHAMSPMMAVTLLSTVAAEITPLGTLLNYSPKDSFCPISEPAISEAAQLIAVV